MPNFTETESVAVIAACAAIIGAIIAGAISHFSNKKRNDFEARVEICKYREKWLSNLREEIAIFNAKAMLYSLAGKEDEAAFEEIMIRQWRILLAIPVSNPLYEKVQTSLSAITKRMLNDNDPKLGYEIGLFMGTSKEILYAEWTEIQNLLYKKLHSKKKTKC